MEVLSHHGAQAAAEGTHAYSTLKHITLMRSSGMTFGTDVGRFCLSSISTPFEAHAYITRTSSIITNGVGHLNLTSFYETVTSSFTGSSPGMSGNGYTTITLSSITTISPALAVGDPLVVAWQINDLALFPAAYATSLANKISVSPPASPIARVQDGFPSETAGGTSPAPAPATSNLSTAAKAGIGVGSAIGALFIATVIIMLWLLKRRKAATSASDDDNRMPEMEDHDGNLGKRKWFLGGRWRSEAEAEGETQELDWKTVHVVPGPPAELEAYEAAHGESDYAHVTEPGQGQLNHAQSTEGRPRVL